ncbi:MAG: SET domain-containing protein-lysine N-methyltransferase [Candidatus Komeilibacteria bacterium]
MHLGWYLNHSKTPTAYPDDDYKWYTVRDIKAGEEITIDYNLLAEPAEDKADYYR